MTAEEWINEFSTQRQTPKTILHASNIPATAVATPAALPHDGEAVTSAHHVGSWRYRLGAMCVAGVLGFVMARAL